MQQNRKYRHFTTVFLALSLMLLQACSGLSTPVVDYNRTFDFNRVQKIGIPGMLGQVTGDKPDHFSDIQIDRLTRYMQQHLAGKGYTLTYDLDDADLILNWMVSTENKQAVHTRPRSGGLRPLDDYFENSRNNYRGRYGGGYGYYGYYGRYSYDRFNRGYYHNVGSVQTIYNFVEGTFMVDMVNPDTGRVVWQSIADTNLREKPSNDPQVYLEAVENLLASFPRKA